MELYIYINNVAKRVEMFNDEKVSVTSSITNYTDIGKLFTDYSQTFTIPASDVNNSIFSHWYESAIDGGFDARVKYNGYIELDTIPFRSGILKLTKANQKNGYVESYSVTFYGVLAQLKDRFKDDKLKDLDYSIYTHLWNSTEITKYVKGDYINTAIKKDLFYPLCCGTKKPVYNPYASGAGDTNNIAYPVGAIRWDELFPALKITKILELIQTKYGVTFTGSFLTYKQFTQLVMLFKNATFISPISASAINIIMTGGTRLPAYNLATNILTPAYNTFTDNVGSYTAISIDYIFATDSLAFLYSTIPYSIQVYNNGVLYATFSPLLSNQSVTFFRCRSYAGQYYDPLTNPPKFTFVIATGQFISVTVRISANTTWRRTDGTTFSTIGYGNQSAPDVVGSSSLNSAPKLALSSFCPDIKVADFFMGLVKLFNIIITPVNETTFNLEPLDLYYQSGKITDLTEYIYSDEVEINAPTLNKSLNFLFEKSVNLLNNKFRELNNRDYGDLIYNDPNISDGGTYEVKLPFENPMFERININGDPQFTPPYQKISTCSFVDKDLKPYVPKPVLMYIANEFNSTSIETNIYAYYMTIQGSPSTQAFGPYVRFGNENNTIAPSDINYLQTLNWGVEISPWYTTNAINGVYNRLYQNQIFNLYNIKSRVLKVKARLSKYQIANIKLKDRIIIRDKRYLINTMTFDLTTNESTFELITDYIPLSNSVGYRYANAQFINLDDSDAVKIKLDLYLGVYDYISIASQNTGWVQWTESGYFYGDQSVEITIAQNTTGIDRTDIFSCKFAYTNGTDYTYVVTITQKG